MLVSFLFGAFFLLLCSLRFLVGISLIAVGLLLLSFELLHLSVVAHFVFDFFFVLLFFFGRIRSVFHFILFFFSLRFRRRRRRLFVLRLSFCCVVLIARLISSPA